MFLFRFLFCIKFFFQVQIFFFVVLLSDLLDFFLSYLPHQTLSCPDTLLCRPYHFISFWMICDISTFMHVPGSCYLFDFIDMPNVFMFILRGAEQGWHIHDEGFRTSAGAFGGVICKAYRGWSFPPKKNTQKTPTLQNGINRAYLFFLYAEVSWTSTQQQPCLNIHQLCPHPSTLPQHPSQTILSIPFCLNFYPNSPDATIDLINFSALSIPQHLPQHLFQAYRH